ncbi:unnamed protein product [Prorocentrum cordatum]|uniref:RRM domain-containing protein n=1 Tax=Prorocentrum cordatum TaxID=2364126 RepID=A0ABN9U662_9DINO|nr:unnamed protein product [Polarella glacialis]
MPGRIAQSGSVHQAPGPGLGPLAGESTRRRVRLKNTFLEVDDSDDSRPPDSPRALSDPGLCRGPGAEGQDAEGQDGEASAAAAEGQQAPGCAARGAGPAGGSSPQEHATVGEHLRALGGVDPRRVLVVRRIYKLGYQSGSLLASHFSKFGRVHEVLVPRRQAKLFRCRSQAAGAGTRDRPGAIGFVVMADAECTDRAMWDGKQHMVAGERITVEPFEPTAPRPEWRYAPSRQICSSHPA